MVHCRVVQQHLMHAQGRSPEGLTSGLLLLIDSTAVASLTRLACAGLHVQSPPDSMLMIQPPVHDGLGQAAMVSLARVVVRDCDLRGGSLLQTTQRWRPALL